MLRVLRTLGTLLPSDRLRTFFYLQCIAAPRRVLRKALFEFYRYDHVYSVLKEFRSSCEGPFSILEFGTSAGYSFVKLLYATRYLHMLDSVTVHGFDSFEGMPASADIRDADVIGYGQWSEGQYRGDYEHLNEYCRSHGYRNFRLHRGRFDLTLTSDLVDSLRREPPILIWIDCDLYTSARVVLERLLPVLRSGCVLYFDELNNMNFGSRLTGEARLVHEINAGLLGEDIELVHDPELSLSSRRLYRFIRLSPGLSFLREKDNNPNFTRMPKNGSPLP